MSKEKKKTALYLACEEIDYLWGKFDGLYPDDYTDEFCEKYGYGINGVKQYFQQQADIPDGWDVVKEILKIIRTTNKFELESYLENVICTRLRQAGMEVDDE